MILYKEIIRKGGGEKKRRREISNDVKINWQRIRNIPETPKDEH